MASEGRSNDQSRGKEKNIRDHTRSILYCVQHSETKLRHANVRKQSPRAYLTSTRRVVRPLARIRYGGAVTRERGDSRWPRRFSDQCLRKTRGDKVEGLRIAVIVPDGHSMPHFDSLIIYSCSTRPFVCIYVLVLHAGINTWYYLLYFLVMFLTFRCVLIGWFIRKLFKLRTAKTYLSAQHDTKSHP